MSSSDCITHLIVSSKDHVALIPEAVDSVLNQEHSSIRVIVFLDWHNSLQDISKLIGSRYSDDVLFITKDKKVGKSTGLNIACRYVQTRYVCFLDADDLVCRQKASVQLKFLENNPEFSYCGTSYFIQAKKGGALKPIKMDLLTMTDIYLGPIFLYSSLMIDLEKLKFPGLDENLNTAMDYKLSHELAISASGANLSEHLVIRRSFASTNGFSPAKRASQLMNHSNILCDAAFPGLAPLDKTHFIALFSLGLAIQVSEPDSVLNRLLTDLGINEFGIQISSVKAFMHRVNNTVSPHYEYSFNKFSKYFRKLISNASSFLCNL